MKLNNKGQILVLFVVLIPIMLLIMVLVIDCGNVMIEKRKLDNVSKMVLDYGVLHIDDEDVENEIVELFELNIDDVVVDVNISNGEISISSTKYVDGVFSKIINVNGFKIDSYYESSIINKEE